MKSRIKAAIIVALSLLLADTLAAEKQKGPPAVKEEVKMLYFFLGQWSFSGITAGELFEVKISGKMKCEQILDGRGISCNRRTKFKNDYIIEENCLAGYNYMDRKIHFFCVSNFGSARDSIGSWMTDKTLYLEYRVRYLSEIVTEEITIKLDEPDKFYYHEVSKSAGLAQTHLIANYTRE